MEIINFIVNDVLKLLNFIVVLNMIHIIKNNITGITKNKVFTTEKAKNYKKLFFGKVWEDKGLQLIYKILSFKLTFIYVWFIF